MAFAVASLFEPVSNTENDDIVPIPDAKTDARDQSLFIQFSNTDGEETGSPIFIPRSANVSELTDVLTSLRQAEEAETEIYEFYIGETQILDDLETAIAQFTASKTRPLEANNETTADTMESVVTVTYQAQAVFRVRPVTRCSSTLPGHKGAVLVALFSPDARALATGSGDCSVRFWDLNTELPQTVSTTAHRSPILCLAWSGDGLRLASGCQGGSICLWKQEEVTGGWILDSPSPLIQPSLARTPGNSKARWIRSLIWRPFHLDFTCRLLAAAYQETSIVIWDTVTGKPQRILTGHEKPVTCLRWGGTDLIYSASQDRTIRVWRSTDGVLCRRLDMHGHWVNCLALSVDYVLRTGPFDPAAAVFAKSQVISSDGSSRQDQLRIRAQQLYEKVKGQGPERLVAGSDDNTLSLWAPETQKTPLCPRMIGHQGVVNDVKFSPDARLIASASFDHSVKIWDGLTGKFLATMFGHVQDVYLVAWSSDSRLLVSGSKDSTLKLWSMAEVRRWNQEAAVQPQKKTKKANAGGVGKETKVHQRRRHVLHDLPGHADAVYALDWSADGQRVVSGGKDRVLKLWRA